MECFERGERLEQLLCMYPSVIPFPSSHAGGATAMGGVTASWVAFLRKHHLRARWDHYLQLFHCFIYAKSTVIYTPSTASPSYPSYQPPNP